MEREPSPIIDLDTNSITPDPTSNTPRIRATRSRLPKDLLQEPSTSSSSSPTTRSATRAKQAAASTISPRRTRSSAAHEESVSKDKGKQKEVKGRRSGAATANGLVINEPVRDPKGKKRAAPESDSEDEDSHPPKKTKSTASPSRTRKASAGKSKKNTSKTMPRKSTKSTTKPSKPNGKGKASAAGPSGHAADDVDMLDGELHSDGDQEDCVDEDMQTGDAPPQQDEDEDDEEDDDGGLGGEPMRHGANLDDIAALTMFTSDFRSLSAHMLAQSSKLKGYLTAIKPSADPAVRFTALQDLNELLVMSNEDTLSGYFQVDAFVKELVGILGGSGGDVPRDEDEDDPDEERDEDAALAAALALSTGGISAGDENPEAQVLASRCLYNLMEALPGTAHTVVYHGAVPALTSKLTEIQFIDLAEQNISTLDKISEECASSIARQGGLPALLNFLDFFNTSVQRTALHAAANCCRSASPDVFKTIREVFPIIRNVLSYPDQRLVEHACLCVIRTIESYHRSAPDLLDSLLDVELVGAINTLLLPSSGSPIVSPQTYTLFLRALSTAVKASPATTIALLEADIVTPLYQILAGVLPPSDIAIGAEQGQGAFGQGLGGGLADMAVMQNLAHRPKEQVEEALSLISELMPPLPKDGVFDHRAYSEKSLSRLVKAKAKADRVAARLAAAASASTSAEPTTGTTTPTAPPSPSAMDLPGMLIDSEGSVPFPLSTSTQTPAATSAPTRIELLRSKHETVGRFMRLIVPILVDVYAASVALQIRTRTLTGLLKAVSFLEPDDLHKVLEFVPMASFIGSILSSRDHQTLVVAALQLVEILLHKLPATYQSAFRREGVLHEIETLAAQDLAIKVKAEPTATPGPDDIPAPISKRSSQLDPQDIVVLRARVIRFKYLGAEGAADSAFETLRSVVKTLADAEAGEDEIKESLQKITHLFASPDASISSFELLKSGLVEELLDYATAEKRSVDIARRQALLLKTLTVHSNGENESPSHPSPFGTLVKRLQESLTRMESFEVVTVSPGGDDSRRNSASLLARQLRLRLVGEGSDIPRNCANITVSIHAIATFQALHDYLRPRVSSQGMPGSRISGMLAAFAAAAGLPPGAGSRPPSSSAIKGSSSTLDAAMASSTSAAAGSSSSGAGSVVQAPDKDDGPRRSRRLSEKGASASTPGSSSRAAEPSTPVSAPIAGPSSEPKFDFDEHDHEHDDGFIDAEVDAEMFDEDESHSAIGDKTVNLAVADDGGRVVAQTPDGTRVATPNPLREAPAAEATPSKGSYASALKTKPIDWHLEFSIEGHPIPLDTTIYGAIHQHEARKSSNPAQYLTSIWTGVYTIKFKKVPGPAPPSDGLVDLASAFDRASSPSASAVPDDSPHSKILRLLRVLHKINTEVDDRLAFEAAIDTLPESAFVNNKLTAKLTRQLEEPMIVASACLPDWAVDLPQHYPFLFPFATRFSFLQSTSFGYARLILKWQSQQNRAGNDSRRDDTFGYLGRLQRQKVRISRKHLLESAIKVLELYGSSSSVLEVEYFEEVGTGLGPTLEFYSLVSREFARRNIKMWHDSDTSAPGPYVVHPTGLFPAPFSRADIARDEKIAGKKRSDIFRVLGQFVAKALLDSRILDMSFNKTFLKMILGGEALLTIANLRSVDGALAASLSKIQEYVVAQQEIDADVTLSPDARSEALTAITINNARLADLSLDFTVPGYDIELRPQGKEITVDHTNVEAYISEVLDALLGNGVRLQVQAFREGFSRVFPISDLQTFSPDEILMVFGNTHEDWSVETLSEALKTDHGFNTDSRPFRDLVQVMASYDFSARRDFLQFITGSPKLPIGGFRGLTPPLTVVRKPHEAPLSPDDYLPSVMTCVNYLKLPAYSTKEVLAEKLRVAMKEGGGSFHLS